MNRSRNWCFTLNNYVDNDLDFIESLDGHKQVKYLIAGREEGTQEHTPHIQGFIIFNNAKIFNQVKAFFGDRYHIEKCMGNPKQNIAYCSKDDDYIEFGEPPKQGARKDIDEVKQMVRNNVPIDQIIYNCTSFQSMKVAETLFKYQKQPPCVKRTIKWYYGGPGSGKTREAINESDNDYYITMKDLKWWDGYTGQKYIIIDDFRKDFCTFHELLRILDRYPYRVNIKGSTMWLQPTTEVIIITSCYSPREVYDTREDIDQLIRRIDIIQEFSISP